MKKILKLVLSIALIFTLAFSFVGCDDKKDNSDGTPSGSDGTVVEAPEENLTSAFNLIKGKSYINKTNVLGEETAVKFTSKDEAIVLLSGDAYEATYEDEIDGTFTIKFTIGEGTEKIERTFKLTVGDTVTLDETTTKEVTGKLDEQISLTNVSSTNIPQGFYSVCGMLEEASTTIITAGEDVWHFFKDGKSYTSDGYYGPMDQIDTYNVIGDMITITYSSVDDDKNIGSQTLYYYEDYKINGESKFMHPVLVSIEDGCYYFEKLVAKTENELSFTSGTFNLKYELNEKSITEENHSYFNQVYSYNLYNGALTTGTTKTSTAQTSLSIILKEDGTVSICKSPITPGGIDPITARITIGHWYIINKAILVETISEEYNTFMIHDSTSEFSNASFATGKALITPIFYNTYKLYNPAEDKVYSIDYTKTLALELTTATEHWEDSDFSAWVS